jgi:ComF family protein
MLIYSILNFIFPVACIICQKQVLERRWSAACPECWNKLTPVMPPMCPQCGIPEVAIEGRCGRCRLEENVFDLARSAVLFNDTAREIVHHLKYADRVSLAVPIGRMLRETLEYHEFTGTLAIPVPLHRSRQRQRGYNQAELIARNLGIRVDNRLVRRRRKTSSQTGLSRAERARNLSSAFEATADVRGRALILVDDVMTTGATMNEISRTLKRAGAERVEVLTFARVADGISPQSPPSVLLR